MSTLLKHFDTIINTPESVKALEDLILDTAVKGKLVSQNSNDEPASLLMEKILEEKKLLIEEKKIKKEKILPPISEEEKPYELPKGWEWVRLGSLSKQITDGAHKTPNYINSGVPFLSVKNISKGYMDFSNVKYIDEKEHLELIKRCKPEKDDILFCRIGTLGKAIRINVDTQFSIFVSVGLIKLIKQSTAKYIELLMQSPYFYSQIEKVKVGGSHTNKINLRDVPNFIIPLPPFAEQKRIIEKVSQLMSFCEELKKRLEKKQKIEDRVNMSTFASLEKSTVGEELQGNLQFIISNLHSICTNKKHVQQLRNAILSLAMKGKLVKQDKNDEPASVLIEKVKQGKEQLIKEKKIKKEKPLSEITEEEKPFELSKGWEWVRLSDITLKIVDGTHHSPKSFTKGDYLYITAKNIKNEGVDTSNVTYVTADIHQEIYSRCNVEKGDILLIKDGATTGIATINQLDQQFSLLSSVGLIKTPSSFISNQYLIYCFRSPFLQKQIKELMKGSAITRITIQKIKNLVIPLPPLNEQKRIIEKVNQLILLCDELERNLQESKQKNDRLLKSVLQEASTVKEKVLS
ncbi:restriction endonuclease subunit S [Priestia megaterium]|uniref:restriction endonuclease subunit S n=1 Tax=Priestia megaterium TaxID=1404 RepID=UPI00177D13FE|nr:restriction endonuclease subunit S [Priestia megaterium]MBD8109678.1 restriction endonuclease subunit S [Priestia megaterium]